MDLAATSTKELEEKNISNQDSQNQVSSVCSNLNSAEVLLLENIVLESESKATNLKIGEKILFAGTEMEVVNSEAQEDNPVQCSASGNDDARKAEDSVLSTDESQDVKVSEDLNAISSSEAKGQLLGEEYKVSIPSEPKIESNTSQATEIKLLEFGSPPETQSGNQTETNSSGLGNKPLPEDDSLLGQTPKDNLDKLEITGIPKSGILEKSAMDSSLTPIKEPELQITSNQDLQPAAEVIEQFKLESGSKSVDSQIGSEIFLNGTEVQISSAQNDDFKNGAECLTSKTDDAQKDKSMLATPESPQNILNISSEVKDPVITVQHEDFPASEVEKGQIVAEIPEVIENGEENLNLNSEAVAQPNLTESEIPQCYDKAGAQTFPIPEIPESDLLEKPGTDLCATPSKEPEPQINSDQDPQPKPAEVLPLENSEVESGSTAVDDKIGTEVTIPATNEDGSNNCVQSFDSETDGPKTTVPSMLTTVESPDVKVFDDVGMVSNSGKRENPEVIKNLENNTPANAEESKTPQFGGTTGALTLLSEYPSVQLPEKSPEDSSEQLEITGSPETPECELLEKPAIDLSAEYAEGPEAKIISIEILLPESTEVTTSQNVEVKSGNKPADVTRTGLEPEVQIFQEQVDDVNNYVECITSETEESLLETGESQDVKVYEALEIISNSEAMIQPFPIITTTLHDDLPDLEIEQIITKEPEVVENLEKNLSSEADKSTVVNPAEVEIPQCDGEADSQTLTCEPLLDQLPKESPRDHSEQLEIAIQPEIPVSDLLEEPATESSATSTKDSEPQIILQEDNLPGSAEVSEHFELGSVSKEADLKIGEETRQDEAEVLIYPPQEDDPNNIEKCLTSEKDAAKDSEEPISNSETTAEQIPVINAIKSEDLPGPEVENIVTEQPEVVTNPEENLSLGVEERTTEKTSAESKIPHNGGTSADMQTLICENPTDQSEQLEITGFPGIPESELLEKPTIDLPGVSTEVETEQKISTGNTNALLIPESMASDNAELLELEDLGLEPLRAITQFLIEQDILNPGMETPKLPEGNESENVDDAPIIPSDSLDSDYGGNMPFGIQEIASNFLSSASEFFFDTFGTDLTGESQDDEVHEPEVQIAVPGNQAPQFAELMKTPDDSQDSGADENDAGAEKKSPQISELARQLDDVDPERLDSEVGTNSAEISETEGESYQITTSPEPEPELLPYHGGQNDIVATVNASMQSSGADFTKLATEYMDALSNASDIQAEAQNAASKSVSRASSIVGSDVEYRSVDIRPKVELYPLALEIMATATNSEAGTSGRPPKVTKSRSRNSKFANDILFYCFDCLIAKLNHLPMPRGLNVPIEPVSLFVKWTKGADYNLRGCIGSFHQYPLREGLQKFAIASATNDSRFPPIVFEELKRLRVTVSMIRNFESAAHYLDWDLGIHGIYAYFTDNRGKRTTSSILPEIIVMKGWTKLEAVEELIRKTGYPGKVTTDTFKLHRFQTEEFSVTYKDYKFNRKYQTKSKAHT